MNMKKPLAVAFILLFIGMSVIPSTGNLLFNDDTTPPVTTCTLDPPEPDGDNGWYVSDVEVTLNATDDMSGVKEIRYRIDGGNWYTIPGDHGTFLIDIDEEDLPIEYYAIDYAGNEEPINSFTIDIDQTPPEIEEVMWELLTKKYRLYVVFICNATDETSGMDRVEMIICDHLIQTINGSGPIYVFEAFQWSSAYEHLVFEFVHYDKAGNNEIDEVYGGPYPPPLLSIIGIILNPVILDEEVTFFAVMTIGSNGIHMFERLTFRNGYYTGYIGKFFIFADFYEL